MTYYQDNRDKMLRRTAAYYRANRDAILQRQRDERRADPEGVRQAERARYSYNSDVKRRYYLEVIVPRAQAFEMTVRNYRRSRRGM